MDENIAAVRAAIFEPLDQQWWDDFLAEGEEIIGCGEHVVVLGRSAARANSRASRSTSGVSATAAQSRFHQFTDARGWVDALAD